MNNSITYRWLEPSNDSRFLDHIDGLIALRGWTPLPSRSTYGATHRILAAFEQDHFNNESIVGWHVIQFITHPEPLWVHPAFRGSKVAAELSSRVFDLLLTSNCRGFMVVADNPVAVQLCERYGMRRVESPVYVGGGEG